MREHFQKVCGWAQQRIAFGYEPARFKIHYVKFCEARDRLIVALIISPKIH